MAEKKIKKATKPKQPKPDKQTVDGIGLSFEEAMKKLANPKKQGA
jgi:hypothetical protein